MKATPAMIDESTFFISWQRRIAAWLVHLFTASGAVFGLLTFAAIHQGNFIFAFWLMSAAILIDAVDGALARRAKTKIAAPKIDGALLDNIIDYVNYVMAPAFFLLVGGLLPPRWAMFGTSTIVLASAYQFTQSDAKTRDHFFKGFPSYWNIVVFYLFFWQTSPWMNLIIIFILSILVFVPIKYVYPSRLEYLTSRLWLRQLMLGATILWGIVTIALLIIYPDTNVVFVGLSIAYLICYILLSLYRTFVPVKTLPSRKKR